MLDHLQRDDWDEYDWERFLQRADVRTAKYQELFETLVDHPERDRLIAREMGWEDRLKSCGCEDRDCAFCDDRFECEAYEMLRFMDEPEDWADDADDLISCFRQAQEISAYQTANEFAARLEDAIREHAVQWGSDEDVHDALLSAQMVAARIAGGHGIGYERDGLCGNIANCKRGHANLGDCLTAVRQLVTRSVLSDDLGSHLLAEGERVSAALDRWIELLRARVWWR